MQSVCQYFYTCYFSSVFVTFGEVFKKGLSMSRKCQVTGKKPGRGFSYALRGIAKKKKGIGLKITGKTKRRFLPNLVFKRFWFPEEKRFVSLRLSIAGMRIIDKCGLAKVIRKMQAEGRKI